MFPKRNTLYTYDAFVTAAKAFPKFGSTGPLEQRKREVAAFLANIAHEARYGSLKDCTQGLHYTEEQNPPSQYCDETDPSYPRCVPECSYHGRGPIQLSWNYNYGPAGRALRLNLLNNPDLVKSDGVIAFKTALWFWMGRPTNQLNPHAVMTGGWSPSSKDISLRRAPGFGMTINLINGGQECGQGNKAQALDRAGFYQTFTEKLRVSMGDNIDCGRMTPYKNN